jgi:hypothetical protein
VTVLDTVDAVAQIPAPNRAADHTTLVEAGAHSLATLGFVYRTNVETGYPFLVPMQGYLRDASAIGARLNVSRGLYLMRIEEGSKFANTWLGAEHFWSGARTTPLAAAASYCASLSLPSRGAAEACADGIELLDNLTALGNTSSGAGAAGEAGGAAAAGGGGGVRDMAGIGRRVRALLRRATGLGADGGGAVFPSRLARELRALAMAGEAAAVLGAAAVAQGNATRQAELAAEFEAAVARGGGAAEFTGFLPYAGRRDVFERYVGWWGVGWAQSAF